MIESKANKTEPNDSISLNGKFDQELFDKIKTIQSLPDRIVGKFLSSKGMLKHKDLSTNISFYEKQN